MASWVALGTIFGDVGVRGGSSALIALIYSVNSRKAWSSVAKALKVHS
jgi:hypothetical protein